MRSLREVARQLTTARTLLTSIVGVVTLAVGFVVLLRSSLYLTLVVVGIITYIAALVLCLYVAFARQAPLLYNGVSQYRFGRYHIVAKVAVVVLLAGGIAIFARQNSRDAAAKALFDPRTATFTSGQVTIAQLQIAQSLTDIAVDATVRNSLEHPVLIKHVVVKAAYDHGLLCCCPPPSTFVIADEVKVERQSGGGTLAGFMKLASDTDYMYPLTGRYFNDNCSSASLTLEFDAAQVVSSRSYAAMRITLPRSLKATDRWSAKPFGRLAIDDFEHVVVRFDMDGRNDVVEGRIVNTAPSKPWFLR